MKKEKMIVDVFKPCSFDKFTESNLANLIKIIKLTGDTYVLPDSFICCGQSAYLQGFHELAKNNAIQLLSNYHLNRPLITSSTSCAGFMLKKYASMFFNTSYHNEFKQLLNNIIDITQYLVNSKKITSTGASFPHSVYYYSSCSSLRKQDVKDAPIILLKNVDKIELTFDEKPNYQCCGNGGLFFFNYPEESNKLTQAIVDEIATKNVEYITSTDSSCLKKIQKVIDTQKLNIKTIHIVDILSNF